MDFNMDMNPEHKSKIMYGLLIFVVLVFLYFFLIKKGKTKPDDGKGDDGKGDDGKGDGGKGDNGDDGGDGGDEQKLDCSKQQKLKCLDKSGNSVDSVCTKNGYICSDFYDRKANFLIGTTNPTTYTDVDAPFQKCSDLGAECQSMNANGSTLYAEKYGYESPDNTLGYRIQSVDDDGTLDPQFIRIDNTKHDYPWGDHYELGPMSLGECESKCGAQYIAPGDGATVNGCYAYNYTPDGQCIVYKARTLLYPSGVFGLKNPLL